jgi:hypothetical protein
VENQACEQRESWASRSAVQWLCFWLSLGEPSLQAEGDLGPDVLLGLQGAQFCGVASRRTESAGLLFLLPMEQWELRVLLAQGCPFPSCFRVKVAGWGKHGAEFFVCQCCRSGTESMTNQ